MKIIYEYEPKLDPAIQTNLRVVIWSLILNFVGFYFFFFGLLYRLPDIQLYLLEAAIYLSIILISTPLAKHFRLSDRAIFELSRTYSTGVGISSAGFLFVLSRYYQLFSLYGSIGFRMFSDDVILYGSLFLVIMVLVFIIGLDQNRSLECELFLKSNVMIGGTILTKEFVIYGRMIDIGKTLKVENGDGSTSVPWSQIIGLTLSAHLEDWK